MSSMSARMPSISLTRPARASVRSPEALRSVCASSRLVCVSPAWMATRSTVSAIAADVRATSSMLADVAVAAVVCSRVADASCSATAESLVADSVTSPRRRSRTPPRRSTMALKVSPSRRTSAPPLRLTRAERSPASTLAAARERATSGRFVRIASTMANPTSSSVLKP